MTASSGMTTWCARAAANWWISISGDLTQRLQTQVDVPILAYDLKLMYLCPECRSRNQEPETTG